MWDPFTPILRPQRANILKLMAEVYRTSIIWARKYTLEWVWEMNWCVTFTEYFWSIASIQCTNGGRLGQSPYRKLTVDEGHPPPSHSRPLSSAASTQISLREDAEAPFRGHAQHLQVQHIFLYSTAGILTSIGLMTAHALTCRHHHLDSASSIRMRRRV
jgi:hypothetical protein